MRLGINGRFLTAPVTGVQRFAHEVLRRIVDETAVTVFVPRGAQLPRDVGAAVVTGRLRGHAWEQLELPRMAAHRCDVMLHPANTASMRMSVPFVLVLHDVLPLTNPGWFTPTFAAWQRIATPRAARAAAAIVTVSEWSRGAICDATGVVPSRVIVAPQGLAPFAAPASAEAVERTRAELSLPASYLLAVGGDARKNIRFLTVMLVKWRELHGSAPALVVVGSPRRRVHGSRTGSRADAAGVDVRTLGRVTDDQLHALYTGALALCSPSLAEGFGRTPLEAIACGTPAVAAASGASAETLGPLASARVVPLSDAQWIDAVQSVSRLPQSLLLADAAALRSRWTWDAAARSVLNACAAVSEARAESRVPTVARHAARPRGRVMSTPRSGLTSAARGGRMGAPAGDRRSVLGGPGSDHSGAAPRVALVHDWLTGTRGGERVLEALIALLPGADLFTLIHVPGSVPPAIEELNIRTSFVNSLPGVRHYYRYCLPLFPAAIERLDLSGYDLVVSSSHCVAKSVMTRGARHLCYCHTPMRYIRDQSDAYLGDGAAAAVRRLVLAPATRRLRSWDAATASRVDAFVANSEHVRRRIRMYYDRDATVVHPPVDLDRFTPAAEREDVHVCAGALVPYKRIDLAVAAFNRSGRQLLVVGDGPQYRSLRRRARRNVTFTGRVSDAEMAAILGRARALVMPMVEDFGIIAVEAQAAGAPVIAYGAGGALETVTDGVTGVHFRRQTPEAIEAAVLAADRQKFDLAALQANAARFSVKAFEAGMRAALDDLSHPVGTPDPAPRSAQHAVASCT